MPRHDDVIERILTTPDAPFGEYVPGVIGGYSRFLEATRTFSPLDQARIRGYDPGPYVPIPAPEIFPTVVVGSIGPPARIPKPQDIGPQTVAQPSEVADVPVIDPGTAPTQTVFENAPGGIYERENPVPTDWDRVYREYVELNQPAIEGVNVADFDWGDFAGQVLGGIAGGIFDPVGLGAGVRSLMPVPGGASTVPNLGSPTTGITGGGVAMQAGACAPGTTPKYVKYNCATGEYTPLRRRRRRRLLTASDLADISSLVAIVGKGAATNAVVTRAVSRG